MRFIHFSLAACLPLAFCGNSQSSSTGAVKQQSIERENHLVVARRALRVAEEEARRLAKEAEARRIREEGEARRLEKEEAFEEAMRRYNEKLTEIKQELKLARQQPFDKKAYGKAKNKLQQHTYNVPTFDYPQRKYGHFKCYECFNRWDSAYARQNKYQICRQCNTENCAYQLEKLKSSGRQGDAAHDSSRCQVCIETKKACN